jgi:hypothetical protein
MEPLDELAIALAATFADYGHPRDWHAIQTALHTAAAQNPVDGLALLTFVRDLALIAHQPDTTVLLTIDKAESCLATRPQRQPRVFCGCCGPHSKQRSGG